MQQHDEEDGATSAADSEATWASVRNPLAREQLRVTEYAKDAEPESMPEPEPQPEPQPAALPKAPVARFSAKAPSVRASRPPLTKVEPQGGRGGGQGASLAPVSSAVRCRRPRREGGCACVPLDRVLFPTRQQHLGQDQGRDQGPQLTSILKRPAPQAEEAGLQAQAQAQARKAAQPRAQPLADSDSLEAPRLNDGPLGDDSDHPAAAAAAEGAAAARRTLARNGGLFHPVTVSCRARCPLKATPCLLPPPHAPSPFFPFSSPLSPPRPCLSSARALCIEPRRPNGRPSSSAHALGRR